MTNKPLSRAFTKPFLLSYWNRIVASFKDSIITLSKLHPIAAWDRVARHFQHDRWKALVSCSIHTLPVTITITLVVLNASETYYDELDSPNRNLRLNALQFAAKLHEIFIIASLSTVVINYIQNELLWGEGLSVGKVLAGLQITNVSSLFSSELWSRFYSDRFVTRNILYIFLFVVLVSLAAVVGPSTAIVMQPTIGWWHVPLSFFDSGAISPGGRCILLETHPHYGLRKLQLLTFCYMIVTGPVPIPDHCPAGGLSLLSENIDITSSEWNFTMPTIGGLYRFTAGMLLQELSETVSETLSSNKSRPAAGAAFVAQTIADSMAGTLQAVEDWTVDASPLNMRYKISLVGETQPLAPQTLSICQEQWIQVANGTYWTSQSLTGLQLSFPTLGGQDLTTDATSLLRNWKEPAPFAGVWMEPQYRVVNNTPSITAAHISIDSSPLDAGAYRSGGDLVKVLSCSLYASWIPVDMYLEPSVDIDVHSSITDTVAHMEPEGIYCIAFSVKMGNSFLLPEGEGGR